MNELDIYIYIYILSFYDSYEILNQFYLMKYFLAWLMIDASYVLRLVIQLTHRKNFEVCKIKKSSFFFSDNHASEVATPWTSWTVMFGINLNVRISVWAFLLLHFVLSCTKQNLLWVAFFIFHKSSRKMFEWI